MDTENTLINRTEKIKELNTQMTMNIMGIVILGFILFCDAIFTIFCFAWYGILKGTVIMLILSCIFLFILIIRLFDNNTKIGIQKRQLKFQVPKSAYEENPSFLEKNESSTKIDEQKNQVNIQVLQSNYNENISFLPKKESKTNMTMIGIIIVGFIVLYFLIKLAHQLDIL